MSTVADQIIDFWLNKTGEKAWYNPTDALDAEIRGNFEGHWHKAIAGTYSSWLVSPEKSLALMILLDQFPRNMFRSTAQAFASDALCLSLAKRAIVMGHDLKTSEPARQFFYLPLMHSESLMDQERCVRLMTLRMPLTGENNLKHARAHRDVIRQFGRFPYRNDALGRRSTDAEITYLNGGGYGSSLSVSAA